MLSYYLRLAFCKLTLLATSLLALALTVLYVQADEIVEMETDLHGIVGKLKGPTRQYVTEVNPASDEG
ncbi:MAG: hypothetical protein WCJ10_06210, partial [Opitutaceae bacterium]